MSSVRTELGLSAPTDVSALASKLARGSTGFRAKAISPDSREEARVPDGVMRAQSLVVIEVGGFDLVPLLQWFALAFAVWAVTKVLDAMWERRAQTCQRPARPIRSASCKRMRAGAASKIQNPRSAM